MKRFIAITLIFCFVPWTPSTKAEVEARAQEIILSDDLKVPPMVTDVGQNLSLDETTRLAVAKNLDIGVARIEKQIDQKNLSIEKSIYDTQFTIDGDYSHDSQQRTSTVLGSREIEGSVEVGLQKKIPLGTTLTVKGNAQRHSTTSAFTALDRSHTSKLEFGFSQPLLKNFFGYIDRAQIRKVKINTKKFTFETLHSIENSILEARNQYWDLVFAYQNLETRRKNLERAQEFLKITREKMGLGLTEKTDRYAAEANVRKRVIDVLQAETNLYSASYMLKVILNAEEVPLIVPTDQPIFKPLRLDIDQQQRKALETRWDLKAFELDIERQGVEVKIKSNERLPELSVGASYAPTSLDRKLSATLGKVFAFDHPQYTADVSFSMPIENRAARGAYNQEKLSLRKLEKQYQKLRLTISQEVDQSIRNIRLASERVRQTKEIKDLQIQKLEEEQKDFNRGRSDSKTIIDFQEDVILAETDEIRALVDYAKAVETYYATMDRLITKVGLQESAVFAENGGMAS